MKTEKERLSSEAIANKRRYDKEYLKEYYTNYSVHISKEEAKKFDSILKKHNLSKVKFFRKMFELLDQNKIDV